MRTIKNNFHIYFLVVTLYIFGCNNDDFSPIRGHELSVLNVYSILDTRSDMQFLKIQKSYFGQPNDSTTKIDIGNINVKITSNKSDTFILRDTIIDGLTDYRVLYTSNMNLQKSTYYNLTLDNNSSVFLSSQTYILSKSIIYFTIYSGGISIVMTRNDAFAGDFHIYVEYLRSTNGITITDRIEVPFSTKGSGKDFTYVYPKIYKKYEDNLNIQVGPDSELIFYSKYFFDYARNFAKNIKGYLRLNKCYMLHFSYNSDFWYYYNSIKGFDDPYSVRQDKPYWTNILNGAGFFGSAAIDSIDCPMP